MSIQLSNDPTPPPPPPPPPPQPEPEADPYAQSTTAKSYPKPEAEYDEIATNPQLFLDKLHNFHLSYATRFKVPTVGGKALDLHRLFVEVTSRGGIEKVIRDRKWKDVMVVFKFPSTLTSASFALRKFYLSLLYHFEQAYYFRKEFPPVSVADPVNQTANGSAATNVHEHIDASSNLELGSSVSGTIDAKFDYGYLITVNLGSEKLKGVLYHPPTGLSVSQRSNTSTVPSHRNRKRYQLAVQDRYRPKPNRSGYNFFFAEHYAKLKPSYYGQEKAITRKIGHLWNQLTDAEKQVYQEKGLRDKERYRTEMLEYSRSSN